MPPIRRSGLTDADIARARRALPVLGPGWTLDRYEDYDRVVSLVIGAVDEQDETPVFALHLATGGILASMLVRDQYISLGLHDRVETAVRTIAATLRRHRPLAA